MENARSVGAKASSQRMTQPLQVLREQPLDEDAKREIENGLQLISARLDPSVLRCWRGNSDPFESFPVTITARVFELLRFDRYYIHEATKTLSIYLGPANKLFIPSWSSQWCSMFSSSDVPILGYLSRVAAIVGSLLHKPDYTMMAVAFKMQAMKRLRSHLTALEGTPQYQVQTVHSVTSLIIAEMVNDNAKAAQVHLLMLKRLVEDPMLSQFIDIQSLFVMLFLDMQGATLSSNHTVLDQSKGGWMERHFWASWSQAEIRLPSMTKAAEELLDPSLEFCGLRASFTRLHEQYMLLQYLLERSKRMHDTISRVSAEVLNDWFYIMTRMTFLVSRLNNAMVIEWNELSSTLDGGEVWGTETLNQSRLGQHYQSFRSSAVTIYARLVASIAAIFYTRRFANVDATPATLCACARIHKAGTAPLKKIRLLVEAMDTCSSLSDTSTYANLRLWVLFVAAQHVQYVRDYCDNNRLKEEETWAMSEFGRHLVSMGISTWRECEAILERFLYYSSIEPIPSPGWFETTLEEACPLERPRNAPMTVKRWVEVDAKAIRRV